MASIEESAIPTCLAQAPNPAEINIGMIQKREWLPIKAPKQKHRNAMLGHEVAPRQYSGFLHEEVLTRTKTPMTTRKFGRRTYNRNIAGIRSAKNCEAEPTNRDA
jgi:hypothetical protein